MAYWIFSSIVIGLLAWLSAIQWGKKNAAIVVVVSLSLLILSASSLMRYSRPNSGAAFDSVHAYLGVSSKDLFFDAYEHLLAMTAEENLDAGVESPQNITITFYGRPELEEVFNDCRRQIPKARFVAIRPENQQETKEGVVFQTMLRDIPQRIRSTGSGMSDESLVVLYYPRERATGIIGENTSRIASLQSLHPKLRLRVVARNVGSSRFSIPSFAFDCPSTVPPGIPNVTGTIRQEGQLSGELELEAHTIEPRSSGSSSQIQQKQFTLLVKNSDVTISEQANVVSTQPISLGSRRKVSVEFSPPARVVNNAIGSKTIVLRRIHVNGAIRETVSAVSHVVAAGVVPAAFLGSETTEKSKLFEGLRAADPNMVNPLGLELKSSSEEEDLKKLISANVGMLIVDADNFGPSSSSPFDSGSYSQLLKLLGNNGLAAVPTLLFVGDFSSRGISIAAAQGQSANSPRKVLLFVDTSGSTGEFAKIGPRIRKLLISEMGVRSFSSNCVNVAGTGSKESLKYELYAVFNSAKAMISHPSVSDIICLYDVFNPGGEDHRKTGWVKPPFGPTANPKWPAAGTRVEHANGLMKRFESSFPAPGPKINLAVMQPKGMPDALAQHNKLRSHSRLRIFGQKITSTHFSGSPTSQPQHPFHSFSEWIQESIMPRLDVTMEPSHSGFPVPKGAVEQFRNALKSSGKRTLVNSFCDYKPRAEWSGSIKGQGGEVILWTEHWNRGKIAENPASPFLIRLPLVDAGADRKVRAYQICIELVSNITNEGSSKQREKLANIFMHVINCASSFTSAPEVQVLADSTGFEFRQRGSASFGLDDGVVSDQLMNLSSIDGSVLPVNWEADLSRLDRPKIIVTDRLQQPSTFDASIKLPGAKPPFSVRVALEDSGVSIIRNLDANFKVEQKQIVESKQSQDWKKGNLPGLMLPIIGCLLGVVLIFFIYKF